jgi:ankyrin repeat protein
VEGNNENWVVQAGLHLTKLLVSRRAGGSRALDAYAEACLDGYLAVIRFMLESGADVNGQSAEGNTPLMDAAIMGNTEAVDLLLHRGAVVDLPNKSHHNTALHAACFKAHEGAVRLLLAAGASTTLEDSRGRSAMDFATEPRHAAVRQLLQQHRYLQ